MSVGEIRALVSRLREAHRSLPGVLGSPVRFRSWLTSARYAQLAAVALVLGGLWVMPALRDALVDVLFPDRVSSGFLGLGRSVKENPWGRSAAAFLSTAYWLGALGVVGALLWLRLPRAAALPSAAPRAAALPSASAATSGRRPLSGAPPPSEVETAPTMLGISASSGDAPGGDAPGGDAPGGDASGGAASEGAERPSSGVPASDATAPAPPARYAVEGELGRGGMGLVYRARDLLLAREIALKQLFPELMHNAGLAARFQREAQVLARLTHPHVVQLYDLVVDGTGAWMAMELVTGGSLGDRLQAEGALPFAEVLRLGVQMADALGHAHAQGVVHRDFKPDNVLLTARGDVKVSDFGIAGIAGQAAGAKLTLPGTMMGSPGYMSPEQISGEEVDLRTDVYALGVTLYEMAGGRPPFEGTATSVLTQHLTVDPPLPPGGGSDLPEGFVALLAAMLQKPADARPADMAEVVSTLKAF